MSPLTLACLSRCFRLERRESFRWRAADPLFPCPCARTGYPRTDSIARRDGLSSGARGRGSQLAPGMGPAFDARGQPGYRHAHWAGSLAVKDCRACLTPIARWLLRTYRLLPSSARSQRCQDTASVPRCRRSGSGPWCWCQYMTQPPSTLITWPVTKADSALARNTNAPGKSSARPRRCSD
jgi:hypothetical protein